MFRRTNRSLGVTRLPTMNLHDAPVVLPKSEVSDSEISSCPGQRRQPDFSIESAGHLNKEWIANLPSFHSLLTSLSYVPPADEFWMWPKHEAFKQAVNTKMLTYHDLLHYIERDGYTFLVSDLIVAEDAPLPHLVYEDLNAALMFCSKQDTMDKQFHLDPSIIRTLFCQVARAVLLDRNYFPRAEKFFRLVEQQQQLSSELLSAWIMCLACAGVPAEAIHYAQVMDKEGMKFDPLVFSLMLHPHLDPTEAATVGGGLQTVGGAKHGGAGPASVAARGMLMQQRLSKQLQNTEDSSAAGCVVHGLFHFYSLTLNHNKKWETVRLAVEEGITLNERTVAAVKSVFKQEQGRRCGPITCTELCNLFAEVGDAEALLMTLVYQRKCELLPEFADHGHYEYSHAAVNKILQKAELKFEETSDPDWADRFRPPIEALLTRPKETSTVLKKIQFIPLLRLLRGTLRPNSYEEVPALGPKVGEESSTEVSKEEKGSESEVIHEGSLAGGRNQRHDWLTCVRLASLPEDKGGVLKRKSVILAKTKKALATKKPDSDIKEIVTVAASFVESQPAPRSATQSERIPFLKLSTDSEPVTSFAEHESGKVQQSLQTSRDTSAWMNPTSL